MQGVKTIRILKVTFNLELDLPKIPLLRGAMIQATNGSNSLFHNHGPNGSIYRYPKIQYKPIGKKASLLCIEEGIEALQDFFSQTDWKLLIGKKQHELRVENIGVNNWKVGLWNNPMHYRLNNWLALNQENYKKYQQCSSLIEKAELLEKILLSNLLSFLQGIDLYVEDQITVKITAIHSDPVLNYKNQKMQAFNLDFSTNLSLPNFIGLGKGSSVGFGVVREVIAKNREKN